MTSIPDNVEALNQKILNELNRNGNDIRKLCKMLIICMAPAILNGFHIYSYVILGQLPNNYTCLIPELLDAGFHVEKIRNISTRDVTNGCNIRDFDYNHIGKLNHEIAINVYIDEQTLDEVPCKFNDKNYFQYSDIHTSIVTEWDLMCDREILRTNVQVALAIGKVMGALLFGILADKYGRKKSVLISCLFYIIFGPTAAFTLNYWIFLVARIFIGIAGSGVFHSANTIVAEFAPPQYRSSLSIIFTMSYPIGMIIFAMVAYLIQSWRYLQLAISVPAFLFIFHYFYLKESPRWLLAKGKLNEAHKVVFGKSIDIKYYDKYRKFDEYDETKLATASHISMKQLNNPKQKCIDKYKQLTEELTLLYGTSKLRKRIFVCHFTWFIAMLAYYTIALNSDNFSVNPYIYLLIAGLVEIPSYLIPIIMLKFFGRKSVSIVLFLLAGTSLLLILAVPQNLSISIIAVALFGRTCISAVIAVTILYTTELFPTNIRNSAIGTSASLSYIGSISAPFIVDFLGKFLWYIPTTICGIGSILAGLLIFSLPETKNFQLQNTVEK